MVERLTHLRIQHERLRRGQNHHRMGNYSRLPSKNNENRSEGYIQDLLESEKMSLCHLIVLPMKAGSSLTLDQAGDHLLIDLIAYQCLIGKLKYLACGTRLDIAFVIGQDQI